MPLNPPINLSSSDGVTISWNAPDSGDNYIENTGRELVLVNNSGVSTRVVTFHIQATLDGVPPANNGKQISVAASSVKILGPFSPQVYNYKAGERKGQMKFTFDSVTNVQIFMLRYPSAVPTGF